MIKLYDFPLSLHAYRARLLLSLLSLEYEIIPVDLVKGVQKSADHLKMHPFGQVPVLVDGEAVVWDSHGILVYLARKYGGERWLPSDPAAMGAVCSWLSVAANEVRYGPFLARVTKLFKADTGLPLENLQQRTQALLKVVDRHLQAHEWFAADRATIADVAMFGGIAFAPEGGVDLAPYPAVRAWVQRMKDLPGYRDIKG